MTASRHAFAGYSSCVIVNRAGVDQYHTWRRYIRRCPRQVAHDIEVRDCICAPTMAEVVEREVSACCRQSGIVAVKHDARVVADPQTGKEFLKVCDRSEFVRHAVTRGSDLAPPNETRSRNVAFVVVSPRARYMQNYDLGIVEMSSKPYG